MYRIFFLTASIYCVVCRGQQTTQGQGGSSCNCDDDDVKPDCNCQYYEDLYKERVVVVVVSLVALVGVLGVVICCCLYNRDWNTKWTKTEPEHCVEVEQGSKPTLPHELTWTTIPHPPPPYTCTRLPYYHPESRDTTLMPPPPYSKC